MDLTQPRKIPKQSRSRMLVDSLLEATRRALVSFGFEQADTHSVAKVAGVSIGSLYQYFPGKEALVAAVIERQLEEDLSNLDQTSGDSPEELLRSLIGSLVGQHRRYSVLYRQLIPRIGSLRRHAFVRKQIASFRERLTDRLYDPQRDSSKEEFSNRIFIATVAIEAVIQSALLERESLLNDDHLIERLTIMCTALFWANSPTSPLLAEHAQMDALNAGPKEGTNGRPTNRA